MPTRDEVEIEDQYFQLVKNPGWHKVEGWLIEKAKQCRAALFNTEVSERERYYYAREYKFLVDTLKRVYDEAHEEMPAALKGLIL